MDSDSSQPAACPGPFPCLWVTRFRQFDLVLTCIMKQVSRFHGDRILRNATDFSNHFHGYYSPALWRVPRYEQSSTRRVFSTYLRSITTYGGPVVGFLELFAVNSCKQSDLRNFQFLIFSLELFCYFRKIVEYG